MDFTLIGDVHIGRKFRSRDIPMEAKGLREEILWAQFKRKIDEAIGAKKTTIIMGDLFDSPHINYNDLMKVYGELKRFEYAPLHTYILAGNHDLAKDKDICSAFEILQELFRDSLYIHFVLEPEVINENCLLLPYMSSEELINCEIFNHYQQKGFEVYGHFEEADFPLLKQSFTKVYTGHIHSPRREDNLVVVGSIMPLTFAEDPTNTFMKTCTLAEYKEDEKAGVSFGRCYRLRLEQGEELPLHPKCLQMSRYVEPKEKSLKDEDLDVTFEPFDLEKLMHEALDNLGLFEEVFNHYVALKMEDVENV